MRKMKVFYAWQSDRPAKVNRTFIEKALKEAAGRLNADDSLGLEVEIDQDTQGLGGTPPISQEIFKKIAGCDVFVGDLTYVACVDEGAKKGTPCPNPNVMVEYGHALSVKGWGSLMPVMNVAYGGPEHLPFDMGHLRYPIRYAASADMTDEERRKERKQLSGQFEDALKVTIGELPPAPPPVAAAARAKAREWRTDAVRKANTNPPVPMLAGPRLVMHLVPATGFDGDHRANFSVMREQYGNLVPFGAREMRSGNFSIAELPGPEVWTAFDPRHARPRRLQSPKEAEMGSYWYGRVHLNGAIEIVTVVDPIGEPDDAGPREFRGDELEEDIVKTLESVAATYRAIGMAGPALAMASLIGVEGHRLVRSHSGGTRGFGQAIVELPDVVIESVQPPLAQALRPLLDSLWHAAGWGTGSPSFFNGNWLGYPDVKAAAQR